MSSFGKTSQAKVTIFFPGGENIILEADNDYLLETETELCEKLGETPTRPMLDFVELDQGKWIRTSGLPYLIEADPDGTEVE